MPSTARRWAALSAAAAVSASVAVVATPASGATPPALRGSCPAGTQALTPVSATVLPGGGYAYHYTSSAG